MDARYSFILVPTLLLHVISVFLFLHGFLWQSSKSAIFPGPANGHDFPREASTFLPDSNPAEKLSPDISTRIITGGAPKSNLGKFVLFLIDALRADFVFSNESRMGFVQQELRRGAARGFIAKARTPTVTLPRLKALTTGAVPRFMDVILNFGTQAAVKDSFIHQMNDAGQRIVFYGDDTWLRMFPTGFHRAEGVTSFLVSDFTQVDNNVTRNLHTELDRDDWDVMVLHYLGLDHIGHLAGPHSSLVAPKLREMDRLIENIAKKLTDSRQPHLLVVLGDHGMTDAGNHGGGTTSEVDTPMVFFSPVFTPSNATGQSSPRTSFPTINQVDLVSTISLLTGTAVPTENTGIFIRDVVESFLSDTELHSGICRLAGQLIGLRSRNQEISPSDAVEVSELNHDLCQTDSMLVDRKIDTSLIFLKKMADSLSDASTEYGIGSMTAALIVTALCAMAYVYQLRGFVCQSVERKLVVLVLIFHAVSLSASSFIEEEHQLWYMWLPTAYVFLLVKLHPFGGLQAVKVLNVMVLHRLGREWNRTGDKWLHLPDIGDWLREPDHFVTLYVLLGISVSTMILMHAELGRKLRVIHAIGLASATFFHYLQLNIFAWIAYSTAAIQFLRFCIRSSRGCERWTEFRNGFVVLACVIVRPHNVPLIAMAVCMEKLLSDVLRSQPSLRLDGVIGLLYFIHAWATFFLFGNANAISSVDVSAGFAGITFYFAPLHGLLIFLHLYIGPIFWLLSFLSRVHQIKTDPFLPVTKSYFVSLFLLFRAACLAVAFGSAVLQRHHLFVWTVFAPKVLYESVHSLFAGFVMFLVAYFREN